MKILCILLFVCATTLRAQEKSPADFGFRHLQESFRGEIIDILIQSKKGEEQKPKPLFLFCQGSLPQPLIKLSGNGIYSVFPFAADSLAENFHVAIIGKPGVPLMAEAESLAPNFVYLDPATGKIPEDYSQHNLLDYYVDRNNTMVSFLQKQPYISKSQLVVAGHSEGSTVAAKMASTNNKITHLIYSGGCPMGRIMAMIGQSRSQETNENPLSEGEFAYWQETVNNKEDMDDTHGDTFKATYDFSYPPIDYLQGLKIPVLVTYGTMDWSAPYNDYLRVEMMRQKKTNFIFMPYIGLEHNFFPLTQEGQPDYEQFNWDKVALDWQRWLENNQLH